MASNPLKDLLKSGFAAGTSYASGRLFGSESATQGEMEQERDRVNSINGNGPVNRQAALQRPQSWTEFFFGPPSNTDPAATGGSRPPLGLMLLALGLVAWFIWKKA